MLTDKQSERFGRIADSIIERDRPGSLGYRRSLGPCPSPDSAREMRSKFLEYVGREYPGSRFGVSDIEGTGGTVNVRVRAYLAKENA